MPAATPSVLLVGAGEFGAATAVALLRSGLYSKVTVIDRATTLPAADAASCDINKVVRWDYSDPDYARLARLAISEWNKKDWDGIYHECGVVVTGLEKVSRDGDFARRAFENVAAVESSVVKLETPEAFRAKLAPGSADIPAAQQTTLARGYFNPIAGWANASKAVEKLYEWIRELGGELVTGASLQALIHTADGGDVCGVRCEDGREFHADKVIVATGSWTASLPALASLSPKGLLTATGQTIAAIQLSPQDAKRYADIPVTMHFDGSGFYSFPPNEDGILKFALHGAGYLSDSGVPRTITDADAVAYTEANDIGWIPKDSLTQLRESLATVYPELAKMPITFTRMCWYSDTPDGDWVFDFHPAYPSLLCASGGSGHAFKFLPIIGELIRSRLEGTLQPSLVGKWRLSRECPAFDPARADMRRKPLVISQLASRQELLVAA